MDQILTLAYLAGLFDGEGTITLTRMQSTRMYRTPVMSLTSTTMELVNLCKETFGGHIITQKVYKSHHKPSWMWQASGDKVLMICSAIIPYIREPEKIRRINLILDRYKLVTVRNGKYDEDSHHLKQQFEVEFFHPSGTIA